MPNLSTDALFILLKSLERAEKRNFKLYVTRNTASTDLKIIQLFDALDKMKDYDEEELLRKNESIQKQQLSNLKAHLYDQILASLRVLKQHENIDLQIHEQLDHAKILYNKGLYLQSLRLLEKIKILTKQNNQVTYLLQVLFLEKKIESIESSIDRLDVENESIKSDPQGDFPDEAIEDEIEDRVREAVDYPMSTIREWDMEIENFVDVDDLVEGWIDSDGVEILSHYDGTVDEQKVNGEYYSIVRIE